MPSSGSAGTGAPLSVPSPDRVLREMHPLPKAVYRTRQLSPPTASSSRAAAPPTSSSRSSRKRTKAVSFGSRSSKQKPRPCLNCARRKKKCSMMTGPPPCTTCVEKNVCCVPQSGASCLVSFCLQLIGFLQIPSRLHVLVRAVSVFRPRTRP